VRVKSYQGESPVILCCRFPALTGVSLDDDVAFGSVLAVRNGEEAIAFFYG